MNIILKYASILIVSAVIMAALLEFTDIVINETDSFKKESYGYTSALKSVSYSMPSRLFSNMNTVPDEDEINRISSIVGINFIFYGVLVIVPFVFPLLRKLNERNFSNPEMIVFGAYISAAMTFIYNFLILINFNSWSLLSLFNMLIMGIGLGITGTLFGITINLFIDSIKKVKENGFALMNVFTEFNNIATAFYSAGIWLLFLVCMTVLVFIRFIV